MEINARYLKKKEPLWEKRQQLIENIPEFWFRVVSTQGRMEWCETSQLELALLESTSAWPHTCMACSFTHCGCPPSCLCMPLTILSMGGVQLLAHPAMEEAISDQDQDVFMHLTRLHVAEHLDGSEQDYRITFVRPPCNHVQLYRNCVPELDQLLKPWTSGLPSLPMWQTFKENPFFENKELWKEYRFKEDEATVTSSPIAWKDTPVRRT